MTGQWTANVYSNDSATAWFTVNGTVKFSVGPGCSIAPVSFYTQAAVGGQIENGSLVGTESAITYFSPSELVLTCSPPPSVTTIPLGGATIAGQPITFPLGKLIAGSSYKVVNAGVVVTYSPGVVGNAPTYANYHAELWYFGRAFAVDFTINEEGMALGSAISQLLNEPGMTTSANEAADAAATANAAANAFNANAQRALTAGETSANAAAQSELTAAGHAVAAQSAAQGVANASAAEAAAINAGSPSQASSDAATAGAAAASAGSSATAGASSVAGAVKQATNVATDLSKALTDEQSQVGDATTVDTDLAKVPGDLPSTSTAALEQDGKALGDASQQLGDTKEEDLDITSNDDELASLNAAADKASLLLSEAKTDASQAAQNDKLAATLEADGNSAAASADAKAAVGEAVASVADAKSAHGLLME